VPVVIFRYGKGRAATTRHQKHAEFHTSRFFRRAICLNFLQPFPIPFSCACSIAEPSSAAAMISA
jgi:hypothetical protein